MSTSGEWLVKMPKYLSQSLNEYGDGAVNGEIGRVVKRPPAATTGKGSTSAAGRSQDVFFCLNNQIMEKSKEKNPSKDYQLPPQEHHFCLSNISDGVLPTVYTRTLTSSDAPLSEQISVVDKVIQRAEVRPVENEQYMLMKRHHFEVSKESTRKVQKIDKVMNIYAPKRDHEANKEREKKKKLMGKRIRSPEDVVKKLMFEAFSEHQYISMSALETITQQSKKFLKQLVKRYCNYNSRGRTYELKPQYRYYEGQKKIRR